MALLSAEGIKKSYGLKAALQNITLYIEKKDKIGVIGVNGTGKSTLLKIIAGVEEPDEGVIAKTPGMQIGYLPQNPVFEPGMTVLEQVFSGAPSEWKDAAEYEAKTILTRLGIYDFDSDISLLSGGQRRRVAIAGALIRPCDLLILDEPTNHIDGNMAAWLEDYLKRFSGALLMVTHDRYFLDRVTGKIAEIDRADLFLYQANYSRYLEIKAERTEMELASERKRQSLLKKELAWIRRGVRARGTKDKSRVERFYELSEKQGPAQGPGLSLSSVKTRMGKKTIELSGVSKSYGDRELIRNFSYTFPRGDRVGLIGANGTGKTTLLNMIAGNVSPDSGKIERGDTIRIGYYTQELHESDPARRVIDVVRDAGEYIETPEGTVSATKMLEKFLFTSEMQYSPVAKLSGGERRRLALLRVLMRAPNVLLLDEPTNDLDIETLIVLEDYIENFEGIVVVVSHDRYFIDKVAERVFVFEEDGVLKQYTGGYSAYFENIRRQIRTEKSGAEPPEEKIQKKSPSPAKVKFTYAEKLEYEKIDRVIEELEKALENKEREIIQNASDYIALQKLNGEKEQLEEELGRQMERWVYLQEIAEKMQDISGG